MFGQLIASLVMLFWIAPSFALELPGHVEWTGSYDGEAVSDVKVIWTRTEEDDFFHDLFLPDVVTLVFKEDRD